jgi:class 3 adenylate cyclase
VQVLGGLFTAFDRLARRHGLEKIKTIGDAYMVAGGLPEPRPDHAQAVAEMALDLRDEVPRHRDPDGRPLAVRIGIDSGPVVAGVIGTAKFSYDLWGDTVNVASRMESQGIAGCIQVTDRTYSGSGTATGSTAGTRSRSRARGSWPPGSSSAGTTDPPPPLEDGQGHLQEQSRRGHDRREDQVAHP